MKIKQSAFSKKTAKRAFSRSVKYPFLLVLFNQVITVIFIFTSGTRFCAFGKDSLSCLCGICGILFNSDNEETGWDTSFMKT